MVLTLLNNAVLLFRFLRAKNGKYHVITLYKMENITSKHILLTTNHQKLAQKEQYDNIIKTNTRTSIFSTPKVFIKRKKKQGTKRKKNYLIRTKHLMCAMRSRNVIH